MYWGSPTASIDWCERNYVVSPYIAEFWNTVTNVVFIVLGLLGAYTKYFHSKAESRFIILDLFVAVVGIGSALFHGTLLFGTQLADELPMLWASLIWIFVVFRMTDFQYHNTKQTLHLIHEDTLAKSLLLFGTIWTMNAWWVHSEHPVLFQSLFIGTTAAGLYGMHQVFYKTKNRDIRNLLIVYFGSLGLAASLWFTDKEACAHVLNYIGDTPLFPYVGSLHGYWHILMAVNTYCGSLFATLARFELMGEKPHLAWKWFFMPYVATKSKKYSD